MFSLFDVIGQPSADTMIQPTNIWGMINKLPNLFSPQSDKPITTPKNRLLSSIYKAEGVDAEVPFGQTDYAPFKNRTDRGEKISVAEARAETSKHLDRHIKRWEEGGSRNVLNAKERGLMNANPEKSKAIRDGEWNPAFLEWYGEIYSPSSPFNDPDSLSLAEKELNKNWLGNVRAGMGLSKIDYGVTLPSEYHTPMEKLERAWELTKDTLSDPLDMYPVRQPLTQPQVAPQQQYEAARMNRPPLAPPQQMQPQVGLPPQRMPPQRQMAVPDKSMMYPQPKPQMAPIDKSMMYPQPKRSLQQVAQTAQAQPALNPFPWLKEVSGSYSYPSPPDRRWV